MESSIFFGVFIGFVLCSFYNNIEKYKIKLTNDTFKKVYSYSEDLNQGNIENFIEKVKKDIISFYNSDEIENVVLRNNIKHINVSIVDANQCVIFDKCLNSSSFVSVLDRTVIYTSSCLYNFGKKCTIVLLVELKDKNYNLLSS